MRHESEDFFIEFLPEAKITREMFFNIFGGVGIIVEAVRMDDDDVVYYERARIIDFSLEPLAFPPAI